jgi:hypothetical protein
VDLEFDPGATILLRWGALQLELTYLANLLLRDIAGGGSLLPLNQGRVGLSWRRGGWDWRLSQEAARGLVAFGPLGASEGLATAGPPPVGDGQVTGIVPYVRLASTAATDVALSSGQHLGVEASYGVSGGLASAALPLQWGPSGRVRLSWQLGRLDALVSELEVRHAAFSTGQLQTLFDLTELWTTRLSRQLRLETSAGVAVARQALPMTPTGPPAGTYVDILPIGGLALAFAAPLREFMWEGEARVRLTPFADRFTGTVYERVEALLGFGCVFRRDLSARLNTSAAWSTPFGSAVQSPYQLVSTEATLGWSARQWLQLGLVGRLAVTTRTADDAPATLLWSAGFSLTLRQGGSFAF